MARRPTTNVSDLDAYRKSERGARISTQDPSTSYKVSKNTYRMRRLAATITAGTALAALGAGAIKVISALPPEIVPMNGLLKNQSAGVKLVVETYEGDNSTRKSQTSSIFEPLLLVDPVGETAITRAETPQEKENVAAAFDKYIEMLELLKKEDLLEDQVAIQKLRGLTDEFDSLLGQDGFSSTKTDIEIIEDIAEVNDLIPKLEKFFNHNFTDIKVVVEGKTYGTSNGPILGA